MSNKSIVIIARAFPPVKAIATERISKLARSFSKNNWHVIILTIDDKGIKKEYFDSKRMDFITNYNIEIIRTYYKLKGLYPIYKEPNGVMKFVNKFYRSIIAHIGLDDSIGWLPGLLATLKRLVHERNIDLILASGSPFLSFYAPYKICKDRCIPYILDFRDLWYSQPHRNKNILQRFIAKKLEKLFMDNAALITTVSEGCKNKLSENTSSNKINVLYNLPDQYYVNEILNLRNGAADLDLGIDNLYFNFVFTGTLYKGRDLSSIAHAIHNLERHLQENVRVHYFGNVGNVAKQNFKQYDIDDLLVDHGSVSKTMALSSLFQADAFISIIHNSSISIDDSVKGIITAKIFDYIILNKPTINIAPLDSETRVLIAKLNAAKVYSYAGEEVNCITSKMIELITNKSVHSTTKSFVLNWHSECVNQLIAEVNLSSVQKLIRSR